MPSFNIVSSLVSKVLRESPDLPEDYHDADASTRAGVERMAEEQNTSAAEIWKVIRAKHEQDKSTANGEGFDAAAVAKAARR